MIYISTSCIRKKTIKEAVIELYNQGFKNIELSGGTIYYPDIRRDLIELKNKFELNFILHNYFPPPEIPFVLNLASLNEGIFSNTITHFKSAIDLANDLDIKRIGIHAGFFVDPGIKELGEVFSKKNISNKKQSFDKFIEGYKLLKLYSNDIKIHIENNVLSSDNFLRYEENIFMLTNYFEYKELLAKLEFPLLLDVAHLKVTCKTLGLDFIFELESMIEDCDYIHISENDGKSDSNNSFNEESELYKILSGLKLSNKTVTIEVYGSLEEVKSVNRLLNNIV